MAIYNRRVEFTREKLIDHYLRRDSLSDFMYGIIRFIGIIVQNIYCVSSYLVLSWIALFPISWIRSDLYSRAENYLYNSLLFIVSSWSMAAGIAVVETGDDFKHLIEEPDTQMNKDASLTRQSNGHSGGIKDHIYRSKCNSKLKLENNEAKQSIINSSDIGRKLSVNQSSNRTTLNKNKNDLNRTNDKGTTTSCPKNSINNNNENSFCKELKACGDARSQDEMNNTSRNDLNKPISSSLRSIQKKPRILLLCNHISTADVPLIMQSFSTLINPYILWVLDAQFKPTNFGLVCISHGDFFITKDSFTDGSLRDQVLKHPDRNLLVLFPEGGFWRKRLEGSNRYALKNGLPMTKYVTHPRFGAFKDLIDPSVDVTHIVDATLLYDDIKNPLSILDIAMGNRKEPAILNYKIYERSKINPTEEWLRNIWLEKDKLLQQYYEDRDSVYRQFEGTMRTGRLDWFKVLSLHLFYLLVCYLTIYRLFSATSVTMLKARDLYYSNI